MGASFIWRMDDITPGMNWEAFDRYIDLFHQYQVKPLLGIVPDNRDPLLNYGAENPDFWPIIRRLKNEGVVEISQHGYQHVYVTKRCGILGEEYGFPPQSEFVGLPYEEQLAKITAGQQILRREQLESDVWMAPGHSFDEVTLQALSAAGFKAVTDGLALYPFMENGLLFVPNQSWHINDPPLGFVTFGLHINYTGEKEFRHLEELLKSGKRCSSFSEARKFHGGILQHIINGIFKYGYCLTIKRVRDLKRKMLVGVK